MGHRPDRLCGVCTARKKDNARDLPTHEPGHGSHRQCCVARSDLSCMLIPCPALLQLIMQTATAGGRPSSRPANSGSGGGAGEGRKAAAAASAAGNACETLEHLSATALLQLLSLADATEQLGALFSKLPVGNGAAGTSAQQRQAGGSSSAGDGAAGVAAAVMPRLPQLLACTDSLLQQGCFKEAQVATPLCAGQLFRVPPRVGWFSRALVLCMQHAPTADPEPHPLTPLLSF